MGEDQMRVAVIVSGAYKADGRTYEGGNREEDKVRSLEKCRMSLKNAFPMADFYYHTWMDYYQDWFNESKWYVQTEPKIDYHPLLDTVGYDTQKYIKTKRKAEKDIEFREKTRNQTKQILAHASMIGGLEKDYDIIVRARHDTYVCSTANFQDLLYISQRGNIAIGLATLKEHSREFYRLHEVGKDYKDCFLFDQLIIHPRKLFDEKKVYELHHEKRLLPAEFGWYQIMNESTCYSGWANPDKHVPIEFIK